MRTPTFYAAVFGIIRNEKGEILFSRRNNTGHLDGYLSLPAGHIEHGETPTQSMRRELREEINIDATDMNMILTQQSHNSVDKRVYYNFYFAIEDYVGTISNMESDKCSELVFLSLSQAKDDKIVPYVREALELIEKGGSYSEISWQEHTAYH